MLDDRYQGSKLFQNGGSQAVPLPAEFRFEGDQVFVTRDRVTGDITLSILPRKPEHYWRDLFASSSEAKNPLESDDDFMSERPMNVPIEDRDVYGDDR